MLLILGFAPRIHSFSISTLCLRDKLYPSKSSTIIKEQSQRRQIYSENGHTIKRKASYPPRYHRPPPKRRKKSHRRHLSPEEMRERVDHAIKVEVSMKHAVEEMRSILNNLNSEKPESSLFNSTSPRNIRFPSVRECNSALATMGDTGDFKRALRLFGLMRKATLLVSSYNNAITNVPDSSITFIRIPSPTLVTYSTLMSRAVSLGKELVALRLWRLMTTQKEFYSNKVVGEKSGEKNSIGALIVPDIRAVNILMNSFAKLSDQRSASLLMKQIREGNVENGDVITDKQLQDSSNGLNITDLIRVVPKMEANIVTFNTYIDACHRAGRLDLGLDALQSLKDTANLHPDATTYTSLISSVARRPTRSSGANDPDIAFSLFDEMVNTMNIRPNAKTFCALIDVCGRCGRSDLALKVLRMMLRKNAQDERKRRQIGRNQHLKSQQSETKQRRQPFHDEVGAWTAAINACGRAGRLGTAIRLFHTMSKFGAKPNQVTCGCLTDCLLKSTQEDYITETLGVLRYMKEEGIEPSEVMYTSLMTAATRLTELENRRRGELVLLEFGDRRGTVDIDDNNTTYNSTKGVTNVEKPKVERTIAIDLYTELILSLVSPTTSFDGVVSNNLTKEKKRSGNFQKEPNTLLVKAFLVFQEMKASGSSPDLACYNALLRACAQVGELSRLWDVMSRIRNDGFIPNNTSWKEMLRGAGNAKRSDVAEKVWMMALENPDEPWIPSIDAFDLLITSYTRQACAVGSKKAKITLYLKVITAYMEVLQGEKQRGLNYINADTLKRNQKIMTMVIRATIFVEKNQTLENEKQYRILRPKLREISGEISDWINTKETGIPASTQKLKN